MPNYLAIFLFFLVAVVPFIAIWDIRRKMTRQERRDLKRHEKPSLYLTAGICITGVASTLLLIFVVGFLLPGLGWIDRNALSEIPIHIPSGSRRRRRREHESVAHPLGIDDVEMTIFISAILLVLLALGIYLIVRGHRLKKASGTLPEKAGTEPPKRPLAPHNPFEKY